MNKCCKTLPTLPSTKETVNATRTEVLVWSVYNESIAVAIRSGAPLASDSIDRRCLASYMQDLNSAETCSLICFLCVDVTAGPDTNASRFGTWTRQAWNAKCSWIIWISCRALLWIEDTQRRTELWVKMSYWINTMQNLTICMFAYLLITGVQKCCVVQTISCVHHL